MFADNSMEVYETTGIVWIKDEAFDKSITVNCLVLPLRECMKQLHQKVYSCYGDTSNILILNCIKIIDTYNTS